MLFRKSLDGNYIVSGIWFDDTDTLLSHQEGWMVKFSPEGNVIWDRKYRGVYDENPGGYQNALYSFDFLSNGDIVAGGEAYDVSQQSNAQQGWLLRLDSLGCLPDSNSCGLTIGIEDIPASSFAVSVYPDPASHSITLSYPSANNPMNLRISNVLGQEVFSNDILPLTTSSSLIIENWPSGIYYFQLKTEQSRSVSGKFVVLH